MAENSLTQMLEDFIFNIGIEEWLISIATFFIYLGIFFFIKKVVVGRLKTSIQPEENSKSLQIIKSVDLLLNTKLAIVIALKMSVDTFSFSTSVDQIIQILLMGLITIFLLKAVNKLVISVFDYYIEIREDLRHVLEFIRLVIRSLLMVIIFIWFLSSIGVDVTAYIASFAVLSLGIAFALQNIIADIFSSIILYFDKPFEIGDTIKVGDDIGTVEKIGLRSTQLRALTGNILIIPNRELSTERINNYRKMEERRVATTVSVLCETPVKKLKSMAKWIEAVVKKVDNTRFDKVHFVAIGASSFDFQLIYFITTPSLDDFLDAQHEVNIKLLEMYEKQGLELPYPTQMVYKKELE